MEIGDDRSQLIHMGEGDAATCQHTIHHAGLGETAHVDRILDGGLTAQHWLLRAAADRNDIEIETGGEAAIEAQLFGAIKVARLQSGKIEEAKIDSLLDLVGIASGQQHPGDVRLFDSGVAGNLGFYWEGSACAQGVHQ